MAIAYKLYGMAVGRAVAILETNPLQRRAMSAAKASDGDETFTSKLRGKGYDYRG
jgi:hypothetical protein